MKVSKVLYGILIFLFLGCKKEIDLSDRKSVFLQFTKDNTQFSYSGNEVSSNNYYDTARFSYSNFNSWLSLDTIQDSSYLLFASKVSVTLGNFDLEVRYRLKEANQQLKNEEGIATYKDPQKFKALFVPGEQTLRLGGPNTNEGFSFTYTDVKNNKDWGSEGYYGFGLIPYHSYFYNSYLNITDVESFYSYENNKEAVRIFANFNITLYDNASPDSIRLDSGSFALIFSD